MTTQTNQAVSNAVQNTQAQETVTLAEVMKNLDKNDAKFAWKELERAYGIQANIEDLEAKVEKARGAIGNAVLAIAKVARTHCNALGYSLTFARHYFLALCTEAETKLVNKYMEKSEGEKKTISTLIPVWPVHKSNIAKGMELGIDPLERFEDADSPKYAEATQYVNAMKEAVKASGANNTGSQAGNQRKSSEQTAAILGTITSGWDSSLKAATEVLNQQLNRLDREEQAPWAGKVLALAAEVTAYAESPERKAMLQAKADALKAAPVSGNIVTDSSGKVTGTTRSDTTEEGPESPETIAAVQAAMDADKDPAPPSVAAATGPVQAATRRRGAREA